MAPSSTPHSMDPKSPRTPPRAMLREVYRYDVKELDGPKAWAMFAACGSGDIQKVKDLIDQNPDLVHAQNWYQTPLHFAVRSGHADIVKLLLENDAEAGRSRFMYYAWPKLLSDAQERHFEEIVKLLEATLARRFGYRRDFETLVEAAKARDLHKINAVCQAFPGIAQGSDSFGNNAIHWAVMTRHLEAVDYFLRQGAAIDRRRADGQTPAHLALNGDYHFRTHRELKGLDVPSAEETVRHLLDRGAEYDLSIASALGDPVRVRAILSNRPHLAAQLDSGRRSPLMYAARGGHLSVVRLLLSYGADPNRPEELAPHGHALFSAAANNHLDIAKVLLEHGADPNAGVDSSGTCLTIARHKHGDKAEAMEQLLRAHGARRPVWELGAEEMKEAVRRGDAVVDEDEFLPEALARNDVELVDLLHEKRPSLIDEVHGGMFRTGNPDVAVTESAVLRRLLGLGFDPDTPDWLGKTALHHYAAQGDTTHVLMLLEAGADIDAVDDELGGTPLAWAARAGKIECVTLLLAHGADRCVPREHPWAQPLLQARRHGHTEVAALLRSKAGPE